MIAQHLAYNDPELEFVYEKNVPTNSVNPTTYTGYLNGSGVKQGPWKIILKSGNEYVDQFNGGLKEVFGRFTYASNGSIYKGEWKKDLKEGKGIQTWTAGSIYDGEFMANKYHGWAIYTTDKGATDEGNWIDGTRNGIFNLVEVGGTKKKYLYEDNKYVREIYDDGGK